MLKLTVELVPKTAWCSNVRTTVSKSRWDKLRKKSYADAGYECEICAAKGRLECHEVWLYDDEQHIQTLERLIALCPQCHQVKHLGFAKVRGKYQEAVEHLMKVNGWNQEQTQLYLKFVWSTWEERSKYQWKLDISSLTQ